MTDPGEAPPIRPLRLADERDGGRGRAELVLLPECPESAPLPRRSDAAEPGLWEAERVLAQSRRYRLAVTRQARRRRSRGEEGGAS